MVEARGGTLGDETLSPIRAPELDAPNLKSAFFTRRGGASVGLYEGLNVGLGSKDEAGNVRENRSRATQWIGAGQDDVVTPYQVHSADVHVATGPLPDAIAERPKCDAVVTDRPGLAIGVVTADCGPVLFADPEAGLVGAAHAGWKGAVGGILEATVESMVALGADRERIHAVLGPTISQANYEVGPEFIERFGADECEQWFIRSERADHFMFDLPGYILNRLGRAGVKGSWTGHCTYADEATFFSYRRTTHCDEPDYGRQLSAIMRVK